MNAPMPVPIPVDLNELDAVVFDIGGVFAIRHHEPVRSGMGRAGFALPRDPDTYHEAHYHAVRALTDILADHPLDEMNRAFWVHFESAYLRHLGVPEADLHRAVEAMFSEVFDKEAKPLWRFLLHDNIAGFHRIVASGIPTAIVTNNDGTGAQQLIDFNICQVGPGPLPSVAVVVDSGLVGVAKPDPAIFAPALDALNTAPARTLYVGDTVHADVLGATAAGMPVVQLDPYGLHAHLPHRCLPGVRELADLLGCNRLS